MKKAVTVSLTFDYLDRMVYRTPVKGFERAYPSMQGLTTGIPESHPHSNLQQNKKG
jgi:hypothetical protein